ncbi:MAG: glycosyltransferase family 1 protein [Flavobacteriales bacterium]|jgi:glycosyltransferase involved in cell wall biosynthesis|nr:MAG: glycosyltransferase family 1 protein [Flavobacteriales bacterium]
MRIAVNTRLLLPDKLEGIGWFTHEVMRRIVQAHPEHEFLFLFDRPYDERFIYGHNVRPVVMGPPTRHPLLYRLWFDWLLPRKLRDLKADAFISPDGFVALRSTVPALAVVHDLNFEHYPEDLPRAYSRYYRSYFPRFARHATRLATVSEFSRRDIAARYEVDEGRIDVLYNGVGEAFRPLDPSERSAARARLTGGAPYFVCIGSLHPRKNIARLLLAFDQLLIQHPSDMRLVIVGERFWWDQRMEQAWKQVRHKERVVFTGRLGQDELHKALGAAHALAFISYFEGFGIPVAEAMRCGVPVVAAETSCLPEVAGDAAHYCDPFSVASISRALYEVWGDGALCDQLRRAGLKRSERYTWEKAAEALWASFERMCHDAGLHPAAMSLRPDPVAIPRTTDTR